MSFFTIAKSKSEQPPLLIAPSLEEVPFSILIVCTGNLCRSLLAERLLKIELAKIKLEIPVTSAGIQAVDGMKAPNWILDFIKRKGLDLSDHSARKLTREMIDEAGLILVMQKIHRESIIKKNPDASSKVRLLGDFYPDPDGVQKETGIPDPLGMSEDFYESVAEMIRLACENLTRELKKMDTLSRLTAG